MRRILSVAVFAAALAACGSSAPLAGGKQGAAQAMYQASQPLVGAGVVPHASSVGTTVTVQGPHGGSATLTYGANATAGADGFDVNIAYHQFSVDGKNALDGTLDVTAAVNTGDDTAKVQLQLKGALTLSGDVSDSLSANVTETVDVSAAAASGATASVTLDGDVTTSTSTFQFQNESFSLSATAALP